MHCYVLSPYGKTYWLAYWSCHLFECDHHVPRPVKLLDQQRGTSSTFSWTWIDLVDFDINKQRQRRKPVTHFICLTSRYLSTALLLMSLVNLSSSWCTLFAFYVKVSNFAVFSVELNCHKKSKKLSTWHHMATFS